jgi:anti-sigma factor RsiW
MNCHDLESHLTPYLDAELVDEARVDVEAHLVGCATCAKQVESERHNLSLLRALVKEASPRAPEALRRTIFTAIRKDERRKSQLAFVRYGAAAAGVAFVLVLANHQYRAWQFGLYQQDAALRHSRQFPLEILQPRADAIEAWFNGKLDHRVNVPHFPNATAAGARILQVRDKPAAYIRYDSARPMGLFVYEDDHDVEIGSEPAMGSSHGYNVVSWREGDVVYQLVTDLDEADLRELVAPHPEQGPAAPRSSTPALEATPASLRH